MKVVSLLSLCLLVYLAAGVAWLCPRPQPKTEYTVKQFCADHPDVCSKSRLASYHTPTPIPQGTLVIVP